jgi:Rps23 Pro-64 3,4-dihydroxylase Tpa1-like proline 4-hydroxylase
VWPAPFVRIEEFLPRAEHDRVLELALKQQDGLELAKVGQGGGDYQPQTRSSWVLFGEVDRLIPWFLPRLEAVLPAVLPRLQIAPFPIREIELQMTVHRTGGHYKVHQDTGPGRQSARRVSYVYYFHRLPRRFTGGDLLLYDTDVRASGYATAFTRLETVDNSIVFFQSEYYHQVTSVRCESPEFADSRFTLNGWVHPVSAEDAR